MNINALRAHMALKAKNVQDLSDAIGISKSALYRRMNGNSNFNCEEIQKIMHLLNLSNEETMSIFFPERVS